METLADIPVSNKFVSGFVLPQRPDLARLNEIEGEIEFERSAWQDSGAIEQFLYDLADKLDEVGVPHEMRSHKAHEQLLQRFRIMTYGNTERRDVADAAMRLFSKLPTRIKHPIEEQMNRLTGYGNDFRKAMGPMIEERTTLGQVLIERWGYFMQDSSSSFSEFALFLEDEEFDTLRGQTRPFLQSLQSRGDKVFDVSISKLIDNTVESIPEVLFNEFISDLVGQRVSSNRNQNILQWLELVSFPSLSIDSSVILNKIRTGTSFPTDLKNIFKEYSRKMIVTDSRKAKSLLSAFQPQKVPTTILGFSTSVEARKRGTRTLVTRIKNDKVGEVQISPERPAYKLAFHGGTIPTEEQLSSFMEKNANRFASNDLRMRNDVETIVQGLIKDPFGLGVAKLTGQEISAAHAYSRVPLRRFRPDLRFKDLEHPESGRLRVVFYLDKRVDPNTIFLLEILPHDEFDVKYAA